MTSDDGHIGDSPPDAGGSPDSTGQGSSVDEPDPTPAQAPPTPPETATGTPPQSPPGGMAPPPSGGSPNEGPGRKLNLKRVFAVLAVVGLVLGGIGAIALGGGIPIPAIGGCDAGTPSATLVSHQSTGPDGERVAFQLTSIENAEYIHIVSGDESVGNMTAVGNTTTVTGLSSGDDIEYVGFNKCGKSSVGTFTVE